MPIIHGICQSENIPVLFDHGYIESPNYPMKYYQEAQCMWHLAVQRRQTVRIILHDFELSVKKGGICNDFLLVEGVDGTQYFKVNYCHFKPCSRVPHYRKYMFMDFLVVL